MEDRRQILPVLFLDILQTTLILSLGPWTCAGKQSPSKCFLSFSIYYRPKRLVGDPAVMMIVKLNYIEVKKQWDYYTVQ